MNVEEGEAAVMADDYAVTESEMQIAHDVLENNYDEGFSPA
ncbi:hypothetical protein [Natranaeroarchaeum aerophilus]|nr:hypothetical protein [Natranaeroarchaeum aerophilus]